MTSTTTTTTTRSASSNVAQVDAIEACLMTTGWTMEKCANCGAANATLRCITDLVNLCPKCNEDLHANPIQKAHRRVPIEDSAPNCNVHNARMDFFCLDCVALCCMACREQSHHGHTVVSWRSYMSERKQDIRANLATAVKNLQGRGTELYAAAEDLASKGATARKELSATLGPLQWAIQERTTQLGEQLTAMLTEKGERIRQISMDAYTLAERAESQMANESASASELAALLNQIENLCHLPIPPSQVSFASIPNTQALPLITKLGCLTDISGIALTVTAVSSSTITVQWPADAAQRQVEVQIADGVQEDTEVTQIHFSRSIFCVTPECMIPWNNSPIIAVRARVSALDILGPWGDTMILSSSGGGKVLFTEPGIHSFIVPTGVSSVDAIVIGGGNGGYGHDQTAGGNSMFGGYAQAAGGGTSNETRPATASLTGSGAKLCEIALKLMERGKFGEAGTQFVARGAYTALSGLRVTPGESVKVVVGRGGQGGSEDQYVAPSGRTGLVAVSWGGMSL
ncbi:hypothetical protein Pelo_16029 [Pelomyxa schiedti]|nr:hypothetical protein Pelo_16029 [Pelomyxa schiedti]